MVQERATDIEATPNRSEQNAQDHEADPVIEEFQHARSYQRYLDATLGLRNHWYPALFAQELKEGETRGETLLGERILFKRAGGKVYAVADRCPHRGVAFSARPECYSQNTITCWYHGFTFDVRDGKLVQVLTEPGCSLIGKVSVRSYPVEEINGVVFIFIGDMSPPPPVRDDIPPNFFIEGLVFQPLTRQKVKGNWRLGAEQGYDASHIYGHRNAEIFKRLGISIPLSTYSSKKGLTVVVEGNGPKGIFKRDDVSVWSAEVEGVRVTAPNVDPDAPPPPFDFDLVEVGLFLPCGLQVTNFPLPKIYHFEWYIPVDEEHHIYMIIQATRPDSAEEEEEFREKCKNFIGPLMWSPPGVEPEGFTNFDIFIREQMQHAYSREDWWHRERLFKPDQIIVQWRALVAKHMRGVQKRGDFARTDG